ncbi:MAG: site-2 protease family protein [Eubacterium sp.]|nr:site-2 protease family protein [Eubacterium sp.]
MGIVDIIIGIVLFFLIILIHEFGHFAVAKLCKMKVREFAIGMGPRILKKRVGETLYCLKALPIGGSVSLDEDVENDDPRSFRNRPVWMRMLVIAAGAFMNFVLGFIFCVIYILISKNIATNTVSGFYAGSVSSAQLQRGDIIKEINGMSIYTTMDISFQLSNSVSRDQGAQYYSYDFVVERDGETVQLHDVKFASRAYAQMIADYTVLVGEETGYAGLITEYYDPETDTFTEAFETLSANDANAEFCAGVTEITEKYKEAYPKETNSLFLDFYVLPAEKTVGNVIGAAFTTFISDARLIWVSLINLLNGTYGLNELSGPIGVVQSVGTAASFGWSSLMTLAALIAINVGIVNLLPIPAMDGARLVFLIIEAIRRKPIKAEHEGMVHFIGIIALMVLMLVVTFNDILRLFSGG